MGTIDRAKSGLAKIGGAAALVEIGRQLWPVVRPAVERGRLNAAAWRTARARRPGAPGQLSGRLRRRCQALGGVVRRRSGGRTRRSPAILRRPSRPSTWTADGGRRAAGRAGRPARRRTGAGSDRAAWPAARLVTGISPAGAAPAPAGRVPSCRVLAGPARREPRRRRRRWPRSRTTRAARTGRFRSAGPAAGLRRGHQPAAAGDRLEQVGWRDRRPIRTGQPGRWHLRHAGRLVGRFFTHRPPVCRRRARVRTADRENNPPSPRRQTLLSFTR